MKAVLDPLFQRMVAIGDSLSQGSQNVGLSADSQVWSVPALLARSAGADLPLPLLRPPGYPPHIDRFRILLRFVVPRHRREAGQRLDPAVEAGNLAVPGAQLADVCDGTCANLARRCRPPIVQRLQRLILNPLHRAEWETQSQLDRAIAVDPTLVMLWVGSNDVMEGVFMPGSPITSPAQFARHWHRTIDRLLAETRARILVPTIPDMSLVPAITLWRRPRLAKLVRSAVTAYNTIIIQSARRHDRMLVVDFTPWMQVAAEAGEPVAGWPLPYRVHSGRLDLQPLYGLPGHVFRGGLISYDGLHPTRTGYGLLANIVIDALRDRWGVDLESYDPARIAATDPLLSRTHPIGSLVVTTFLQRSYGRSVLNLERDVLPFRSWADEVTPAAEDEGGGRGS